jgi:hypothetical protein
MYGAMGGAVVFVTQVALVDIHILTSELGPYYSNYVLGLGLRLVLFTVSAAWAATQRVETPSIALQVGIAPVAILLLALASIEEQPGEMTMSATKPAETVNLQDTTVQPAVFSVGPNLPKFVRVQNTADSNAEKRRESIVSGLAGPPMGAFRFESAFLWVFLSALFLTLSSGVASVILGVKAGPNPPPEISRLVERFSGTWTLGFGAVIGLIGGQQL